MAQIIQFPCGTLTQQPAPTPAPGRSRPAPKSKAVSPSKISSIRRGVRVPKSSRAEDEHTAMLARLARSWADTAYERAQTEPNSERHRMAVHMAGIVEKLPRNNLRVYTTATDIVEGIRKAWRRANIASLEWKLAEERRLDALGSSGEATHDHYSKLSEKAEAHAWREYERLVRVPAKNLADFKAYKLDSHFERGMGSIVWMRTYKPDLAAILDEEEASLIAQKDARAAARAAKKREAGA